MISLLYLAVVGLVSCSDFNREILGVEFNRLSLYNHDNDFMCLDGSATILISQVNDDYCDCADGSDEPGTSACPNGKFFCSNKGHNAHYIPSSRVNDGICDCCDGSDEYSGIVTCPNICHELGAAARIEKERLAVIARKGFAVRKEMAAEGLKLKNEKVNAAEPLRKQKEEFEPKRQELENRKKELEEKEKTLMDAHRNKSEEEKKAKKTAKATLLFQEIDKDGDAKISATELLALPYLDTNDDGQVTEGEIKVYISADDGATVDIDLARFTSEMFDEISREKKDYESHLAEEAKAAAKDADGQEQPPLEEADSLAEEENEDLPTPYDAETQKAIDEANAARNEYSDFQQTIRDIDDKIKEAEQFAAQDFGPDYAWAPLKGKCFDFTEMQYTYTLCPFDKTQQKDKGGYGGTSLGTWGDWSGAVPRKYSAQKYENGQTCWNGPARSTKVIIECGDENELIKAVEPAKCEYEFTFRTPAACNDPDKEEPVHVEL